MEAEPNPEVPVAVAETQEVPVQPQEEKSELKSEEQSLAPSDPPEKAIETAADAPEKQAATECEAAPPKPLEPEEALAKSQEETPAENPPEAELQRPEEPQHQVTSEPEKQEQEAVKEVEPKKQEEPVKEAEPVKDVESKPSAVCENQPEEAEKTEAEPEGSAEKEAGDDGAEAETEAKVPLFFGWFLLAEEEERIKCATMDFLKTLDTLEAFKEHISEFTGEADKEVDLEQYFQNPMPLHCTAMFCDYGKAEGAKEYTELQVVKDTIDKSEELSVTALFVTPRTFGARVALTDAQMKLWPEGADKVGVSPQLLPRIEALPPGSRAHVTLGCSAGVEAVLTGFDLLEILALQKEGKEGTQVEMEMGTLAYLTEGRWFLTLREPITADTKFSSFFDDKPASDQVKKDGEKKKKKCTIL
ncbi:hypothetical protein DNTS_035257 [Danionella cerebrum]|uniref:Cyclic nucleotide phosphodiesterase catalytic domain-containing protein n=1 Tax=Danionella cerebrum TaxID=2873325 RepID=A0A553N331_9TELE|nr:hypothetical protein DNTS_035257 [Danionella translucida]